MLVLASSTEYICIALTGPFADLTGYPVSMALVLPGQGAGVNGEPADNEYQASAWINGEVCYKPTAGQYPPGEYIAYVRIVAAPEDVRLLSGRVRIGDART
jgi:hypothetical protein